MFSDRENKIWKVIGRKKMTIKQITSGVFETENAPFDSEISISNSIRRIMKKCKYHKTVWTLKRTMEDGKLTFKRERR